MPVQTQKENFSIPDGVSFEISDDNESTWFDMGVMTDGISWTHEYALTETEWGNAENPNPIVKNPKLSITPSELATWESEAIEKISAGLVTKTVIAGTPVAGFVQTVLEGNWVYEKTIYLSGQNADGTSPTINSVVGTVDNPLGADDWTLVKGSGGWYIVFLDGTLSTTEAQDIAVDYDYTPDAGFNLKSGSTSQVLVPYVARFRHYTDVAQTAWDFELKAFRVYPGSGGMSFNKLGAKSDNDYDTYTVALTCELDSGKADGEGLFNIFQLN